ncbi:hypothetical protein J2X63_000992 [Agromyces sp. 3263]|uniref:hypothetical protein n=1 Tax=Agromyces sp. 3263 TaxID=2817750 RepID=UPI0028596BB3|nr:hypothetical protein [Agromyces sp. 3263]MDR6905306.1 hypothetical protein [Agromyces sp. 3263]
MPRPPDSLIVAAAHDNAAWCAAVCRANGIGSRVRDGLWTADGPTPDGYPEAVTLTPGLSPDRVAEALPAGARSVKDSFADVDLGDHGFRVLFDASWIVHEPGSESALAVTPAPALHAVSTADEYAAWAALHGGTAFAPALLDDPRVVVLAGGDPLTHGAVLTDAGDVVGLSNVVGEASAYRAAAAEAASRFPGRIVVGWEAGEDLATATAAGFTAIGDLRVWLR